MHCWNRESQAYAPKMIFCKPTNFSLFSVSQHISAEAPTENMLYKIKIDRRFVYAFAEIQNPKQTPKIWFSASNHISAAALEEKMHYKIEIYRKNVHAFAGIQNPEHMHKSCDCFRLHRSNHPKVSITKGKTQDNTILKYWSTDFNSMFLWFFWGEHNKTNTTFAKQHDATHNETNTPIESSIHWEIILLNTESWIKRQDPRPLSDTATDQRTIVRASTGGITIH